MHKHVTISVDGEDVALCGERASTQDILTASGLESTRYDLQRVLPDGSSATLVPATVVALADGDEFVTARISTTTA
jgi:hypothetical protein